MPDLTLDHVIIGVADLRAASEALGRVLGRRPSWRGRHPSYGTANVLFRLENSYLELLAPDPDATTDTAWTGSLGRFLHERGEGLFSIALQTPDVFAATAQAREKGLPVEEPLAGDGVDLNTQAVREWVNARIPPEATRGTRCFFIQHKSPAPALPMSEVVVDEQAAVIETVAAVATSNEAAGARLMWREVFALSESVEKDGWSYDLGNATLFLQSPPRESSQPLDRTMPDRWDSLVLRVQDLRKTTDRLKSAGIEPQKASLHVFDGIEVIACGARILLTGAS